MPSVAYARMMKGEAAGVEVGVTVGWKVGVGALVGVAGVEQDANKMASRLMPGKKRRILSKSQVQAFCQGVHRLSHDSIQIRIWVFE